MADGMLLVVGLLFFGLDAVDLLDPCIFKDTE